VVKQAAITATLYREAEQVAAPVMFNNECARTIRYKFVSNVVELTKCGGIS
jgi:hypothetical protein